MIAWQKVDGEISPEELNELEANRFQEQEDQAGYESDSDTPKATGVLKDFVDLFSHLIRWENQCDRFSMDICCQNEV